MLSRSTVLLLFSLFPAVLFAGKSHSGSQIHGSEPPYPNSRFIEVDSVRLHYRVWVDSIKKPIGKILFIHGFCGSTFCWRKNAEPLAREGYKVVAVDLPSFGYSGRYPSLNQSNGNRAKLLWMLLNEIDHGDTAGWNICGHSMGGGIAEAMALLNPGQTRSLIIIDGLVFLKSSNLTNTASVAGRNRQIRHVMVHIAERNVLTYKRIESMLRSAYGRPPDSSEVNGYLAPLLIEGTADAAFGIWTQAREEVKMDIQELPPMPVLIVWVKKDPWIGISKGRRFQKAVPGSEMVVLSGKGHIPMETHAGEFNNLLISWLSKE